MSRTTNGQDAFVAAMIAQRDATLAELDRLCGPICEHDGKRASEHTLTQFTVAHFSDHSPAPEIEEWLRRNTR